MIHLADNVAIEPDALISSRLLIQADSGGGKSYLLRLIAEGLLTDHHVLIIDPEGEFGSLRGACPDMLVIGADGDVAPRVKTAAATARLLTERRISAVIDLYEMTPVEQHQYVRDFLNAICAAPKEHWHPMFILIDEAHEFAPESGKGEACSLEAVARLMKRGRKRGFAGVVATQRFSSLSKDVANLCSNVIVGPTTPMDSQRAADLIGVERKDRRRFVDLRRGQWIARGPAFATRDAVEFKANQPKTRHVEPGNAEATPAASADIQALLPQLRKLTEQADKPTDTKAAPSTDALVSSASEALAEYQRRVDQLLANEQARAEIYTWITGAMQGVIETLTDIMAKAASLPNVHAVRDPDSLEALRDKVRASAAVSIETESTMGQEPDDAAPGYHYSVTAGPSKSTPVATHGQDSPRSKLSGPLIRIVDAIAWRFMLGVPRPSVDQVGMVAGYAPKGGSFNRYLSTARSDGLIERDGGTLWLTPLGSEVAVTEPQVITIAQLHRRILQVLSGEPKRKILRAIIDARAESIDTGAIADAAGYAGGGGSFNRYLSDLSRLGLITRSNGRINTTNVLWPRGIR